MHAKLSSALLASLLAGSAVATASGSTSVDAPVGVSASGTKKPQTVPKSRRPKPMTGFLLYGESEPSQANDDDLAQMVKSFDYLLSNEKSPSKRASLMLSQASAALAAARNMRLKAKPDEQTKAAESNYSELAIRNADAVLKLPEANNDQKFKAHHYAGIANINLGKATAAKAHFITAIGLSPRAKQTPDMSLYVAETSFDQELYKEAIDEYKQFFSRFTDSQKSIAIYKTAWCDFILGDLEGAEKNFLALAGNKKAGAFADDSVKDLAYVLIQHRDENEIIAFTADRLPNAPATRLEILTAAYRGFQTQSATVRRPILFAELMRLEQDPGKKLALLISNLHASARRYASEEPFSDFAAIRDKLTEWKVAISSTAFIKNADALENEIKALAQSFAETFAGRVQSPEKIAKEQIGSQLIEVLAFHIDHYPKSADRVASFEIWFDVCSRLKDVQCSYDVSKRALADTSLTKLKIRARQEYLAALEKMQVSNPQAREELIAALTEVAQQPMDKTTEPLVKRLTELLNEEGNFATSIPLLLKIDAFEHTPESRFRCIWAQYQAGRYAEVAAAPVIADAQDHFSRDTQSLMRESNLRLADAELKAGDFDGYDSHIVGYLANHPDPSKVDLVRTAYIKELCDRNKFEKAQQMLLAMPATERFKPGYIELVSIVIGEWLRVGEFARGESLLADRPVTKKPTPETQALDSLSLDITAGLPDSRFKTDDFARMAALPKESRHYLLTVLAVTDEDAVINYFHSVDLASSPDRELLVLASQVKAGQEKIALDAKTIKALGDACPLELRNLELTKVEKDATTIVFPSTRASEKTRTRMVQDDAERTRLLRKRFVRALDGKTPAAQLRILETAATLEEKVANVIEKSPMPRALAKSEVEAYAKGIGELAKEFSDQAGEYRKLKAAVEEKAHGDQEAQNAILTFVPERWPASTSAVAPIVDGLLQKGQFTGALIVLDRWKSLSQVADEDYYRSRVHILLSKQQSDFMKSYAYGELVAAKQDGLLEQWKQSAPAKAEPAADPAAKDATGKEPK